MLIIRAIAVLAATATLGACQDAGERSVAMLRPGDSYIIARIDGAPAPEGVTLDLGEGGRVTGKGPCNRYSGQVTEKNGAMTVSGLVMTRMACLDPARNLAETKLSQAMGSVTAAHKTADGIALTDPEGKERVGLIAVPR